MGGEEAYVGMDPRGLYLNTLIVKLHYLLNQ